MTMNTHSVNGSCTYEAFCTFTVGEQIEFEMWILVIFGSAYQIAFSLG